MDTKALERNEKGLYRADGRGRWRTEWAMNSLLPTGARLPIFSGGERVGVWVQHDFGHSIER